MADIVSDALKGDKGATSTSEKKAGDQKSKAGQVDPKAADKAKAEAAAAKGEGKEDIPKEFHKHPAWQKLKTQRDEARADSDRYKTDSEEFGAITGFMQQHNIGAEEVAETLQWLAVKNTDPVKFYNMLSDWKAKFDTEMGFTLSKELQARVDAGEISEVDARALSKSQAEAALLKNMGKQATERTAAQQDADKAKTLQTQMSSTVNEWEKQIQVKDPDYQHKKRLVQSEIRSYIQQYGMPKSPQQALKYATVAYETITEQLGGMLPQRKANSPTPQGGRQAETQFVPKSIMDVVSHELSGGS